MPRRRPPGAGPALRTSNLFAILLILPWISTAAQQQHPPERSHSRSPLVEARLNTDVPPKHGKHSHQLDDSEYQHSFAPNYAQNVRAVATTVSSAPAVSAVRAPPAGNAATSNNLERPRARSLQDWLVEEFVLLATVDGHIHARDRYTGDPIWELSSPKPMLEVIYNKNNSDGLNGWQDAPFLWIVEPKEDGALYVLTPGAYPKLQPLGMTIKQMTDEMNPYTSDDPPVVYTAKKESSMYVVDARTGNVTKIFSPSGSMSIDAEKCKTHGPDYFDSKESDCRGILNLGQTDYTISIHNKDTLEHVCTIKYSEWTPNNRDRDLQSQYAAPMDQHYIYSRYNGNYLAYDHKRPTWRTRPVYERKLPYPVARVFDVARGRDEQDPEASLILLPQPLGPAFLEDKAKNVWLNTTDLGSWYALSESNFPAVTDGAPTAPCYMQNSLRSWDGPHFLPPRGGLVGVHELDYHVEPPQTHRAIAGPTPSNHGGHVISIPPEIPRRPTLDPPDPVTVIETPKQANWSPMMWTLIALMGCLLVGYQQLSGPGKKALSRFRKVLKAEAPMPILPIPPKPEDPIVEANPVEEPSVDVTATEEPTEARPSSPVQEPKEKKVTFDVPDDDDEDLSPLSRTTTAEQPSPVDIDVTSVGADGSPQLDANGMDDSQELGTVPTTPTKKKKTHRGKRGGQKGKNKKPKEGDEMDQIVEAAKHLNEMPPLHPDEITPYGADMQDVSNVKKIGKLTIDFDRVLGNGSGGTFVFEGKWNDRDVAIKRMLPQYFGLAEQEVKLLQESDHHANVIRYYDDEKDENFLYIAVELCQASLFDLYRDGRPGDDITDTQQRLVNEINGSVPRALHQLAEGVHHLHSLRIIHRDIKPQNILIAYPQRNQKNGPRLVISDFGLCKTLPDNMSTLIGTTGNAGTVGWKAPELILQPRDIGMGSSTGHSRDSSNSTDPVSQGVKRAVDIFSLGCVFFYVLTNGSHPFDDDEGWAQMREYNIKKNKASFDQLRLGDDSEEPVHLISWMLENRPEDRPTAAQVMNHPFFWNAEKRLAFLCDCSDHWEREQRDPPSDHLSVLEDYSYDILDKKRNFLAKLDHGFIASLGKQRKYTGDRILDLLRALRNKKNHYEDMDENVKAKVGPLPHGYLTYWTVKFPRLLMSCYDCVVQCGLQEEPRFKPYFQEPSK